MAQDLQQNWVEELGNALQAECNGSDVRMDDGGVEKMTEIARSGVWKICLDVSDTESKMDLFDDIFDLPEQKVLREDCHKFVSKLGNNEEDKISVLSDLESILTCHCKNGALQKRYEENNGWIDLLLPLLTLKIPRSTVYNLFEAIYDKYIPRHLDSYHLTRLLLQYHDPELCNFLDSKKITSECFAFSWYQSLFASTCSLPVILSIWDLYFQKGDPFFIFFLAIVIIINDRELIMSMKDENKQEIVEIVTLLPSNLTSEDATDFCALAQYYDSKTPTSFRKDLIGFLFSQSFCFEKSSLSSTLSQALCLPVSAEELILNCEDSNDTDSVIPEQNVRFFLIDCRPAEQYNSGHPPTAFHLDSNLMLQEPNSFSTAVQGLLSCQRQAIAVHSRAGGEHLCFLGCGELLADQYTHMVVASFLQKHTQYVSILTGGYEAFHKYLGDRASSYLRDHSETLCPVCSKDITKTVPDKRNDSKLLTSPIKEKKSVSEKPDIFAKLGAVMKLKSAEMKEKLVDYITNPNTFSTNNTETDRHVKSSDKLGKPYRNLTPIFSIDEDHEPTVSKNDGSISGNEKEDLKLSTFLQNPSIVTHAKCQEVTVAGYFHDCYLVITKTHLMALRVIDKKDHCRLSVNRLLSSIARITCRKKHPEYVTFQYGSPSNITDMDKFLIPNSNEITRIISEEIAKNIGAEKDVSE